MKITKPHPMQPVVWDGRGVVRFQSNPIVRFLLDWASSRGMSLNELTRLSDENGWTSDDWAHFAQLHGYSVSGWGSLSYVSDDVYAAAAKGVEALLAELPEDPDAPPGAKAKP